MTAPRSEAHIQQDIRLLLGSTADVRVFRNNVGRCQTDDGRHIRYGLIPGSGDLIGWRSVVITPEMVGSTLAQFTSIEVKAAKGRLSPEQIHWAESVQAAGGVSVIARSTDDVRFLVA